MLRVVRVLPSCARDWHRSAVLAVGLVFVLRCAAGYGDPVMIGEDWWVLFEDHLWGRDLGCLVRPYAGYVSFGPRLLGWAASFLPAGATCFALAWAAGCIGAVALGWLASPRFAILLPDPRARAFVAVTLAMLPVGNAALLCAAMFSHWHMLFALCLMTVARPPETRRGRACELVVGGICAWSHPLALLLAPAFAWRAWTAEATADRRHYAALTLLVLAYAAFGMDGSATMASPGETLKASAGLWTNSVVPALLMTSETHFALQEYGVSGWWMLLPPLVLLGGLCRAPALAQVRVPLLALFAAAVLVSVGTAASRWATEQKLLFASPRYVYVPSLLLAAVATIAALRAAGLRARLVGCVLALHVLALHSHATQRRYAVRPVSNGRVVAFAHTVKAWAREPGPAGEARRLALPGRAYEVVRPALGPDPR